MVSLKTVDLDFRLSPCGQPSLWIIKFCRAQEPHRNRSYRTGTLSSDVWTAGALACDNSPSLGYFCSMPKNHLLKDMGLLADDGDDGDHGDL